MLGAFRLARDGETVAIGGGKEAAVAALLATRAGATVSAATLISALWGDDPPRTASKTLQGYVSRLRRSGVPVVSTGSGYEVSGLTTDAAEFERLFEAGRSERLAGAAARAAARLNAALLLWRGPALAEFADVGALAAEATRLEELRLLALEERIEAELAMGRHAEVVADFAALLHDHPYRERFWAQLVIALYRSGRQADALATFQRCRRRLVNDLGIEPGAELQSLERAVLAQDRTLDLPLLSRPGQSGTVTVLATDIVGSTQRWEAHPEAMRRAVARHDELVLDAVKIDGGQPFKATGDGHFAVFPVAADAIAAAVAVQRAVLSEGWADVGGLTVRIAVATGVAEPREGDWFGPAVNRAARLLGVGSGGQVVVSDATAHLVEHDLAVGVRLRDLGDHRFKGLAEAERVWDLMVDGLPADFPPLTTGTLTEIATSLPGGLAMLTASGTPFVGRDAELGLLVEAWRSCSDGQPRLMLVSGEPGIGKTRLVAELARVAHLSGAVVLHGRADADADVAFAAWAEALTPLASTLPADILRTASSGPGRALVAVVPAVARRLPDVDDAAGGATVADRLGLFESIVSLLARVASAERPALVVLDDLHWADQPTLALLRHVLHSLDAADLPMCFVVTYRDTDLDASRPLAAALAELRREPATGRVALGGLVAADVATLAAAIGGAEASERAADIFDETDGNPFFVGEIARWLATGSGGGRQRVPEGVREVVTRRIAVLPEDTRRLLAAAAVLGPEWDLGSAASLCGLDDATSLDAVDAADHAGLVAGAISAAERYQFAHAIIRTTVYDGITSARRSRLHRQAATLLEDFAPAAEIAYHLFAAGSAEDLLRGAEVSRTAAAAASAALAWEEAIRHAEAGLDALETAQVDDDELRAGLMIDRARGLRGLGDATGGMEAAMVAGQAGRLSGSATALADAAVVAVVTSAFDRLDPDLGALLDDARDAIRGVDPRREVDVLLIGGLWRLFIDPDRAIALIEEAVAVARTTGDHGLLARALVNLASDIPPPEQHRLEEVVDELRSLPRVTTDEIAFSYITLDTVEANIALRHGDRQAADAAMQRFEARSSPRDFTAACIASGRRYHTAVLDGRVNEGRALEGAYLAASQRAFPPFMHMTNMNAAQLSRARALASFADVAPMIEAIAAQAPDLGMAQVNLAVARAVEGNLEGAREVLDRLASDGFRTTLRRRNPHWDLNLVGLTLAAVLCGDELTARTVLEEAEPVADLCASYYLWMFFGSFHHHIGLALGTLGRYEEAAEHLREALPPERRWGSALWVATTTDALGAVLSALGDTEGEQLRAEATSDAAAAGIGLMTAAWKPGPRPS